MKPCNIQSLQEFVICSHIQNVSKYFATGILTNLTCVKRQDFLSEIALLAKYTTGEEPVGSQFPAESDTG
jgi:hypothetical protein